MKRRVLVVFALLLLGAVVNVGVAVTLAYLPSDCEDENRSELTATEILQLLTAHCDRPEDPVEATWWGDGVTWFGNDLMFIENHTTATTACGWGFINRRRSGLPMRSLWGETSLTREGDFIHRGVYILPDDPILDQWYVAVPFQPLPVGFGVNTGLYAAMLWMLAFAPRMARHTFRLLRDRCPGCAYPIGASPVCTECGRALPRSALAQ